MNMNLNQLAMLQKAKTALERFRANHPKFPAFLDTIQKNAMRTERSWRSLSQLRTVDVTNLI